MQILKADTEVKVVIGPFVDFEDGVSPETGITLGAADQAEILKHDAGAVTDISSNTWAAITGCDGWYNLTITAGQLDTEGMLTVIVQNASVALPVMSRFMVVSANVYDSLYGEAAEDYLQVDVTQVGGTAVQATGGVVHAYAEDGTSVAKDSDTAKSAALTTVDTEVGQVLAVTNNLPDSGALSDLASLESRLTALRAGYLDNLSAGAVALDSTVAKEATIGTPVALDGGAATIGGMLTKMADDNGGADFDATDDSLNAIADGASGGGATAEDVWTYTAGSGRILTAGTNLNDLSSSDVETAAQNVIETNHLDHLFAAAFDPASKPGNADALLNSIIKDDDDPPEFTTAALVNAPGGSASGRYEVLGSCVQDDDGKVYWVAWLEFNGQPQTAVSNCRTDWWLLDGDGTITDLGTDSDQASPDAHGCFNAYVEPTIESGMKYKIRVIIEYDSSDYVGFIPFAAPVRATA
jgi:hypothetical protein